ncbi:pilin [Isoalcanivorax pacificus]
MSETGALRTIVETCMMEGRDATTTPPCQLGMTASNLLGGGGDEDESGEGFPDVTISLADNTASIDATFGQNASSAISGSGLTWSRDDQGTWACSTTVDAKFAPSGCPATTGG